MNTQRIPLFYLMTSENDTRWGAARADDTFDELALWDLLEGQQPVDDWSPLQLEMNDGSLPDLPPTDVSGRVCSVRLREVLDSFGRFGQWLEVFIAHQSNRHQFFLFHQSEAIDVLSTTKSKFVGGRLLKPHLSAGKVGDLPYFCIAPLDSSIVIRDDVRQRVEALGLSGISFQHIEIS